MIGAYSFGRGNLTICEPAQVRYKRQLMISRVDLASKQSGMRAVFFSFPQHLKCIERRSCRSAENANHHRGIIADELLQSFWAEIWNLEKYWTCACTRAREQSHDAVVHKSRNIPNRLYGSVRNEYLQKMSKVLLPRFLTKCSVSFQRVAIQSRIVVERNRIQA